MLIGPAAAFPGGQSSGAGGYADILNLQTMTVPVLAFAAVLVGRFSGCNPSAIRLTFRRHVTP